MNKKVDGPGGATPGSASAGAASSGIYQTAFANRDMKVNKMYAKYLEKFGNSSAEAGVTPPNGAKPQDGSNFREGNTSSDHHH